MSNEHTVDKPLNSREQACVVGFLALVLFVTPVFGVGLFVGILLGIGLYLTRRTKDFSYLANANLLLKVLLGIAAVGSMAAGAYWAMESHRKFGRVGGDAIDTFVFSAVATVFLIAFEWLFVQPLKRHSEWVASNGIFATKARTSQPAASAAGFSYPANPPLPAADELLKWAKLKDAGHITAEQFDAERAKILSRV